MYTCNIFKIASTFYSLDLTLALNGKQSFVHMTVKGKNTNYTYFLRVERFLFFFFFSLKWKRSNFKGSRMYIKSEPLPGLSVAMATYSRDP